MQILYTPKEAEDHLLNTAEQCRTPAQAGSYSKDESTFELHEEFNAELTLQTDLNVSDTVNLAEITAKIEVDEESTGEEIKQVVDGTKREISHMIRRGFPGKVEVERESQSSENVHEIEYQVTF